VGFFVGYRFFNTHGPAYGFIWGGGGVREGGGCLKVIFDKTVFVKFNFSNNLKQTLM
jgi:hypothetical protein